ncbi:MAG TPA: hypothetical protein VGD17_08510 [Chitinophagaceae bacterium]
MKNSTLVVFLMLAGFTVLRAERPAALFHVDNIILKNFQAIQVSSGARITWEFSSEEKDVTCNLEKSADGINFVPLRTIFISSTRQQAIHTFTDRNVSGQSFYRLRITKETYSPYISQIVSISVAGPGSVNNQSTAIIGRSSSIFGEISSIENTLAVRLIDLRGQSKIKQYMRGTELDRNFKTSISNLPSGYYVVSVRDLQNKILMNKCIYKF